MKGWLKYARELMQRADLFRYLVIAGMKDENRNGYWSWAWWLLDPLLGFALYYFLAAIAFDRGGDDYAIFLIIGLVVWRWTSASVGASAKAIVRHASIIAQANMPKAIFPLARIASHFVRFLFGLGIVAVFMTIYGAAPDWKLVFLPVVIVVQLLFLTAVGLLLAYVCVWVREAEKLVAYVMRAGFLLSPVVWTGSRLPAEYRWMTDINPVAVLLDAYRCVLLERAFPPLTALALVGAGSMLAIVALLFHYSRHDHKVAKAL